MTNTLSLGHKFTISNPIISRCSYFAANVIGMTECEPCGYLVKRAIFCSHWANRTQNFGNVIIPWCVHVCQIWSGLVWVCWTYSQRLLFQFSSAWFNIPQIVVWDPKVIATEAEAAYKNKQTLWILVKRVILLSHWLTKLLPLNSEFKFDRMHFLCVSRGEMTMLSKVTVKRYVWVWVFRM